MIDVKEFSALTDGQAREPLIEES